jgi:hypothetical protein
VRFLDEFCRTRPPTCSFIPMRAKETDSASRGSSSRGRKPSLMLHLIKQVEQVARFALEARPGSFPGYRT